MLKQLKAKGELSIIPFLKHIRNILQTNIKILSILSKIEHILKKFLH